MAIDLKDQTFGVEIEFTGITRERLHRLSLNILTPTRPTQITLAITHERYLMTQVVNGKQCVTPQ